MLAVDALPPVVTDSYRAKLTGAFRQRMCLTAMVGFVAACALRSTALPPRRCPRGDC
jgi:hypothetical protein